MGRVSLDLSKLKFTAEELRECYVNKQMSQRQVANHFHVDVRKIRAAMDHWGIQVRFRTTKFRSVRSLKISWQYSFTKEEFCNYYTNGMPSEEIAELLNIGRGMVSHIARKLNLPIRPKGPRASEGSVLKELYGRYRRGAIARNLAFEITFEQFQEIIQRDCYYCGQPPVRKHRRNSYNGVDRTDSTKGYVLENVRPCCSTCNFAKREMTEEDFYAWIKRLINHNPALISEATFGNTKQHKATPYMDSSG